MTNNKSITDNSKKGYTVFSSSDAKVSHNELVVKGIVDSEEDRDSIKGYLKNKNKL